MGGFPKPNDGKLGSLGRSVTQKQSPAGTMQNPAAEICAVCGVPHSACPGHYKDDADKLPSSTPTPFMPTPFTTSGGDK